MDARDRMSQAFPSPRPVLSGGQVRRWFRWRLQVQREDSAHADKTMATKFCISDYALMSFCIMYFIS